MEASADFKKTKQIGFIAQDVEKIIPEVVNTKKDGYKSMSYGKLTTVLVEAVKELNTKVDKKDIKISTLEKKHN